MAFAYKNVYWLWLSAAVMLVDQVTKQLVVRNFELYDVLPVIPHFNLIRLHNTGAAFSMLSNAPPLFFVTLGVTVSVGILIWMRRHPQTERLMAVGLALILGGALGNVMDRVGRGHVVDFIDVYWGNWHFAAFNVADMAISVGAAILILDAFLQWRRERAEKSA